MSPFHISRRAPHGGGSFHMVKFRSMVVNADKTGVTCTFGDNRRITSVGRFVMTDKIVELIKAIDASNASPARCESRCTWKASMSREVVRGVGSGESFPLRDLPAQVQQPVRGRAASHDQRSEESSACTGPFTEDARRT